MAHNEVFSGQLTKKPRDNWGLKIIEKYSKPIVIEKVEPGSTADKWGVKSNDVILVINGKDTKLMGYQDVTDIIRHSSVSLDLVIQRRQDTSVLKKQPDGSNQITNKKITPFTNGVSKNKLMDFNLEDAVSSLTITGTNISLDREKTKDFLLMSISKEIRGKEQR